MRNVSFVFLTLAFMLFVSSFRVVCGQFESDAMEPLPPLEGALFLHGGGTVDPAMRSLFVKLAGGKQARLLVILAKDTPLSSKSLEPRSPSEQSSTGDPRTAVTPHAEMDVWNAAEPLRVDFLRADSREDVAALDCDELLDSATAIWIEGGMLSRLVEIYVGTKVEAGVHKLFARGGLVGGTSAGAEIATKKMFRDNEELAGFNLLPGAIIDPHFIARERAARLGHRVDSHPDQVGFGIDEETALIMRGRQIEVVGASVVTVMIAASSARPARRDVLKPGDTADLVALRRTAQARQASPFPVEQVVAPKLQKGSLLIAGGGNLPREAMEKFIQLAGGEKAKIVYVPCEEAKTIVREPGMVRELRRAGAGQVSWLHTKDRKLANDPAFVQALSEATGVWFGGGRQWNLVDSYQNTEAHRLMHLVLERGGVIGGSSAGASIQGDYMPRGDPLGNTNMMAEGYERGLGFLRGVAIDQHFSQRNRFPDMALLKKTFPQLLGIGIDEGTCLVVEANQANVIGPGKVAFYDQPVDSLALAEYTLVAAEETYDLIARKVVRQ